MHLLHSQPRRVPRRPLRHWMVLSLRLLIIFLLNHLRTFIINMLHSWSLPIYLTNSFLEIQDKKIRVYSGSLPICLTKKFLEIQDKKLRVYSWSLPICLNNDFLEIKDKKLRVSESNQKIGFSLAISHQIWKKRTSQKLSLSKVLDFNISSW